MSTATIGKRLQQEIINDMDMLLGKGRLAFPCPLGQAERKKVWHSFFDPAIVAAEATLKAAGYRTTQMTQHFAFIRTDIDGKLYDVTFKSDDDELLATLPLNQAAKPRYIEHGKLSRAYPREKEFKEFVEWMRVNAQMEKDFNAALECFTDLLKFCGTVGQLVRAVPEVQSSLPGKAQSALRGASRASNMPFEWALFDRDRIANLQMCMCKAHLYPNRAKDSWSKYHETWAKEAAIA